MLVLKRTRTLDWAALHWATGFPFVCHLNSFIVSLNSSQLEWSNITLFWSKKGNFMNLFLLLYDPLVPLRIKGHCTVLLSYHLYPMMKLFPSWLVWSLLQWSTRHEVSLNGSDEDETDLNLMLWPSHSPHLNPVEQILERPIRQHPSPTERKCGVLLSSTVPDAWSCCVSSCWRNTFLRHFMLFYPLNCHLFYD